MTAKAAGRVAAALALVLAAAGVRAAVGTFLQDLDYARVQTEISFWGRGTYQPPQGTILHTGDVLAGLLRAAPAHPEYLELQAHYLAWRAYWTENLDRRGELGQASADSQYLALLSRPANRQGWSNMVEYAARTHGGENMLQLARQKLVSLRPPVK